MRLEKLPRVIMMDTGGIMFQNIGATEWAIIAAVLLLLFGGKKLPELAKGIGDAIRELKTAVSSSDEDEKKKS